MFCSNEHYISISHMAIFVYMATQQYSYGPPHMAVQKQDDQHEHTFSSYVRIRDVVLKNYLGRWTIGRSGETGSEISVLPARYDNDDEGDGDTNYKRFTRYVHLRTGTRTRGFGNKRMSRDHPNYSIVEISQNTEKCPGDLLSLKLQRKTNLLTLMRRIIK